jgi:Kef-type K+ transport system membrane component KefB
MRKVALFTALLIVGLVLSQVVAQTLAPPGTAVGETFHTVVRLLTMLALSFIMIHVGYEFELDKRHLRRYGWDYFVAFTAASFPWILVTLYFVFVMLPSDVWSNGETWRETLLAGRFSAPTSAGVLFTMLAAAGLGATWVFQKARVLAIFDDLDTVLLMIPLQMLMVGLAWQLGVILAIIAVIIWAAYRWLHQWRIPVSWPWVLGYAAAISIVSEAVYDVSKMAGSAIAVHLEVLLPAFALGCAMHRPEDETHVEDTVEGPEGAGEERADTIVSAAFMVLVGLSMPSIFGAPAHALGAHETVTAMQPASGWGMIALHVLAVTALSNLGKMFPAFCYRREVSFKERLAVAIGMWPRGEVGAGVLVISLGYGIGGPIITVALLSLALNLALTGAFIMVVRRLLAAAPGHQAANLLKLEESQ